VTSYNASWMSIMLSPDGKLSSCKVQQVGGKRVLSEWSEGFVREDDMSQAFPVRPQMPVSCTVGYQV
jgi:hypothetical protein